MEDSLAIELKHMVLEHRLGDGPSIKALSHASRVWLILAQAILFRNILIVFKDSPERSPSALVAMFKSSPHLSSYVAHLLLCGKNYPNSLQTSEIIALFHTLPNARALTLDRLTLVTPAPTGSYARACLRQKV